MFPVDQSEILSKSKREKRAEKKLKKQQRKFAKEKQQLEDHLQREEIFNLQSNLRGQWPAWCETLKTSSILEDLKVTSRAFPGSYERRNHAIEVLNEERSKVEEHHISGLQNCSDTIDTIKGSFLKFMRTKSVDFSFSDTFEMFSDSAALMYEGTRENLMRDFSTENSSRCAVLQRDKTNFENLAHAFTSLAKAEIFSQRELCITRKYEIEADSLIQREIHTHEALKRQTSACDEIKAFIKLINEKLKLSGCLTEYQKMLKSSNESEILIREANNKIHSFVEITKHLDAEIRKLANDRKIRNEELEAEKSLSTKILANHVNRIKSERAADFEKINILVDFCERQKLILKRATSRATNFVKLSKMCCQYERPCDKYCRTSFEADPTNITSAFLMKVSSVEEECLELKFLKRNLKQQNSQLQVQLKLKESHHRLAKNLKLLNLDCSPSMGQIIQISHEIPQLRYLHRKTSRNAMLNNSSWVNNWNPFALFSFKCNSYHRHKQP